MLKKVIAGAVIILFIAAAVQTYQLTVVIGDVREAQRSRIVEHDGFFRPTVYTGD